MDSFVSSKFGSSTRLELSLGSLSNRGLTWGSHTFVGQLNHFCRSTGKLRVINRRQLKSLLLSAARYTQVSCAYSLERYVEVIPASISIALMYSRLSIYSFRTEVLRLYSVYESHLSTRPFLVGSKPSYADFCTQPWMRTLFWAGESIDQFPNIKAYVDRIEEMGFVKRALEIPERDLVSRVKGDVGVGGEDHGGDEESERGEREGEERSGYGGEGWKGMIGTQLE